MLSRETLDKYRRMTVGERLQLTLKMTSEALPYMFLGTPEEAQRRFELLRRENDERNRNILEALARSVGKNGPGESAKNQSDPLA